MKLTVQKLKELIKEEVQIVEEGPSDLVGDIVSLMRKAMEERHINVFEHVDDHTIIVKFHKEDNEHVEKVLKDVKKISRKKRFLDQKK